MSSPLRGYLERRERISGEMYANLVEPYAYKKDAVARFDAVKERIVEAGLNGQLEFATRPIAGGVTSPLPKIAWQTETVEPRFHCGQINPRNLFSLDSSGEGFEYLFVTEDSLKRFLENVQRRAASQKSVNARTTGQAACEEWLTAEVKKSPDRPSKLRDEYKREALSRFGGLSKNGFTRAWAAATKHSALDDNGRPFWNKGGPRTRRA